MNASTLPGLGRLLADRYCSQAPVVQRLAAAGFEGLRDIFDDVVHVFDTDR